MKLTAQNFDNHVPGRVLTHFNETVIDGPLAVKLLGLNLRNRPIAKSTVDGWALDIIAGRWQYSGASIGVTRPSKGSPRGYLSDGQHRLEALLRAIEVSGNTSLVIVADVKLGLEPSVQAVVDTGRPRNNGDIHKLVTGESYGNLRSARTRIISMALARRHRLRFSYGQFRTFMEEPALKAGIDMTVEVCPKSRNLGEASIAAAFAIAAAYSPRKIKTLYESLKDGTAGNTFMGKVLHNYIQSNAHHDIPDNRFTKVLTGLLAYLDGVELQRLQSTNGALFEILRRVQKNGGLKKNGIIQTTLELAP